MQQFLKPAARTARAEVVASELFAQFFLAVDDAQSFLYARLGWESSAAFTGELERGNLRVVFFDLPYFLLIGGCG
jgi:hypothetical protein